MVPQNVEHAETCPDMARGSSWIPEMHGVAPAFVRSDFGSIVHGIEVELVLRDLPREEGKEPVDGDVLPLDGIEAMDAT
jgi:hypothetical protein